MEAEKSSQGGKDGAEAPKKKICPDRNSEPTRERNGLASLPTDALVFVLCRCPSADHAALRRTCRAIRSALDSDAYRGARASGRWAEVTARLVPGKELYEKDYPDGPEVSDIEDQDLDCDGVGDDGGGSNGDGGGSLASREARVREQMEEKKRMREDLEGYSVFGRFDSVYGYHDIVHEVRVDGIVAGRITSVLFPRSPFNDSFHEATDAHSQELQEVGWALCDSRGRPRVRSIKDADVDDRAGLGGFLHVISVRISPAYRPLGCTNVVTDAVRSAIAVPELEGEWTLATAISDAEAYMTGEDKRYERAQREKRWRENDSCTEWDEKALNRRVQCALLDTRTFLRVGYAQIPEVVGADKNKPCWLFALPRFLKDRVKTFEEVAGIVLHKPEELPPKPGGVDDELLKVVKESGNSMRHMIDASIRIDRKISEAERNASTMLEENERELAESRGLLEMERPAHVTEEKWEGYRANLDVMESKLQEARAAVEREVGGLRDEFSKHRTGMVETTETFKRDAKKHVDEGGASVRRSFALHCCAALRIPEYFDALLEMVPPRERSMAVSDADFGGCTPLHCAVANVPELRDAGEYHAFAKKLLSLGADRDARDPSGLTPLGRYWTSISSRDNFVRCFGISRGNEPEAWRPFHEKMERALMPLSGETDADREARPSSGVDGDVDGDDDEEDDDDFDDEEEDEDIDDDDIEEDGNVDGNDPP